MYSPRILSFFVLATVLLLSMAQQIQRPLKEHQLSPVIPLKLDEGRSYTFESALDGTTRLSSQTIADIESHYKFNSHPQSALIDIPLDPARPGRMVLDTVESNNDRVQQNIDWIDTLMPGEDMPITHVGIRKGSMVSKYAYSTRIRLETPYISLPGEIYDILTQATNPTPLQHGDGYDNVVDCDALDRYPDLVLGLKPETDEEEDGEETDEREIVVTPKQYVLRTKEDHCILLVQRSYQRGGEEVLLGWAAVRGRDMVFDWTYERTGFGR